MEAQIQQNEKINKILNLIRTETPEVIARELTKIINSGEIKIAFNDNLVISLNNPQFVIAHDFKDYREIDGEYKEDGHGIIVKIYYQSYTLILKFYDLENNEVSLEYYVEIASSHDY